MAPETAPPAHRLHLNSTSEAHRGPRHKEATKNTRTRMLSLIGATVASGGLVLGLAFAGASSARGATPTTPTMHSMMLEMTEGTAADDILVACDENHDAMAGSMTSMPMQDQSQHETHHGAGS